jgi:hypothetical protein
VKEKVHTHAVETLLRGRPFFLAAALMLLAASSNSAIPEPDLVWYGKVLTSSGGATVRLTTGTLAWRIERIAGGSAIVVATQLTNINDQFSFALRVPCESPEPGGPAGAGSTNAVNLTTPPIAYRRLIATLDGQPLTLISAASEFSPLPAHRGRIERVDLQLGTAPIDSDGDGLADAWEQQHFGSLGANPIDDPDSDGMNNLREFRAGTNPTDAQSLFEVVEISKVANGVSVRWSSQTGRNYRVRRATTPLATLSEYDVVQENLSATPPINQFIDTTVGANPHFFYLIEVQD